MRFRLLWLVMLFLPLVWACSKKTTETQQAPKLVAKSEPYRFWTDFDTTAVRPECPGRKFPTRYRLLKVDITRLTDSLMIQGDSAGVAAKDTVFIEIPLPDGSWETFRMTQVQVMAPELAAKYQGLKNYSGVSVINPADQIRFNLKPEGVNAMITGTRGSIFLDVFCKGDNLHMISFNKKDMPMGSKEEFEKK